MEKKELIKWLKERDSAMDVYRMKDEIIRHLEGKQEKKPAEVVDSG